MIYGKDLMSISAMILMKGLLHLKEKEKQTKRFHILPVIGLHQNPTWELIYILAINLEFIAYPQCQKEIIILHRY